jgi:DNA/RNA-binding domain of Phe-tRNA-synthetase-like protein
MDEGPRIQVASPIFDRYPGYRALVVYAEDLRNGPSDERSRNLLRAAEAGARHDFDSLAVPEHPHIAAWRSAYGDFGAKPSRFWSSAEALVRRALKGGLPTINRIVDVYNAVSVKHVVPVGGEDRDLIASGATLAFAAGGEPFETVEDGRVVTATPEPGEPVWLDAVGVTCRRWNWRQGPRTALTEGATSAVFVIDALPPYGEPQLHDAGDDLIAGLLSVSPGCRCESALLDRVAGGSPEGSGRAGR